MFVIGIDPHKASYSAAVLDADEELVGDLCIAAGRSQREKLLDFAVPSSPARGPSTPHRAGVLCWLSS